MRLKHAAVGGAEFEHVRIVGLNWPADAALAYATRPFFPVCAG
jgi:hypothetical protein